MPPPDAVVGAPATHPLQLGQVLYPVQDTTLIFLPPQAERARYQRVSFRGTTERPEPSIHDTTDLGPIDDIRSARAVTHFGSGKQEVVILGRTGLSAVALHGDQPSWKAVPGTLEDALLVFGFDPVDADPDRERRRVALLVGVGPLTAGPRVHYASFAVSLVGLATGQVTRVGLPAKVRGVAVAAELVRRGLSAMLVIATITDGALHVHTLAWSDLAAAMKADGDLAAAVKDDDVQTLPLPNGLVDEAAEVSVAVTRMRTSSSDQQLALAWADRTQACQMALVGWKGKAKASVLATATPDLAFATPEKPIYRLASADLLHKGCEQLVLGYPATYGKEKKVRSCAALMMFQLDEPAATPVTTPVATPVATPVTTAAAEPAHLTRISTYAVANIGDQPLASYDLRLGAGLFGTCLGVQVIGGCASFKQLQEGHASVVCGFVGVNPDRTGFPPMPTDGTPAHISVAAGTTANATASTTASADGHVLATMDTGAPRVLAFASDLSGRSVLLGPPRFESVTGRTQILAYVQVPPYDKRTVDVRPTLTITTVEGTAKGLGVSTDKSYTLTKDVTFNMGLEDLGLSLSRAMHSSYGESFSKMDDTSESENVSFHKNFVDADHLLIYAVSYNVWRYQVLDPLQADDDATEPAEVIVVIPQGTLGKQDWTPAHEFAYKPRSEVGMLLSYVNQQHEGFEQKNLVFLSDKVITVTTTNDGSGVILDKSTITSNSESRHFSVLNSVSDHVAWTGKTELFEFLPESFGLSVMETLSTSLPVSGGVNIGTSTAHADSRVETTHLTVHEGLTVSVTSGSVSDPLYEYKIRPLVYRHATLGCLMVTWEVQPSGKGWIHGRPHSGEDKRLTSPELRLMRPVTDSHDKIFNAFSRAISFKDRDDGSVDVTVEIFNNGTTPAQDVSCVFYEGQPDLESGPKPSGAEAKPAAYLVVPEVKLGTVAMEGGQLVPLARRSVELNVRPTSPPPLYITVQLCRGATTGPSFIYWGVHPPETPLG